MPTPREAKIAEYNAAIARGDTAEVERLADELLRPIHERQLIDWDPNRRTRGNDG